MNAVNTLKEKYCINTTWREGKPYFGGVAKYLPTVTGDIKTYKEISDLMIDTEKHAKEYYDDRIFIGSVKSLLILYPSEIIKIISKDEELYIKALKRGKSERRYRINERRMYNDNKSMR